MSDCPHGLDTAWCGVCKNGPTRPEPVTVVATFAARYEGHCNGCNLPIAVGQVVHKQSNETYVHQGCEK